MYIEPKVELQSVEMNYWVRYPRVGTKRSDKQCVWWSVFRNGEQRDGTVVWALSQNGREKLAEVGENQIPLGGLCGRGDDREKVIRVDILYINGFNIFRESFNLSIHRC